MHIEPTKLTCGYRVRKQPALQERKRRHIGLPQAFALITLQRHTPHTHMYTHTRQIPVQPRHAQHLPDLAATNKSLCHSNPFCAQTICGYLKSNSQGLTTLVCPAWWMPTRQLINRSFILRFSTCSCSSLKCRMPCQQQKRARTYSGDG